MMRRFQRREKFKPGNAEPGGDARIGSYPVDVTNAS
jgi:hypothetical protein